RTEWKPVLMGASASRHRRLPITTPTSATTANVPKSTDLEPVRIRPAAASRASSPAPATRVENRCIRTSRNVALGGSPGRAPDSAPDLGFDAVERDGGAPAIFLSSMLDTDLPGLRPRASTNMTVDNSAFTAPTAASAANGPSYRSTQR